MVHVSIGAENRDLRDVAPGWLRAAIEKRRHAGASVCIRVSITSGMIDMILATPDCPAVESEGIRPFRGEEIQVFHDWQAKRLDTPDFSVGELEDFLKSLRRFQS
jgi:hypothetical protein